MTYWLPPSTSEIGPLDGGPADEGPPITLSPLTFSMCGLAADERPDKDHGAGLFIGTPPGALSSLTTPVLVPPPTPTYKGDPNVSLAAFPKTNAPPSTT